MIRYTYFYYFFLIRDVEKGKQRKQKSKIICICRPVFPLGAIQLENKESNHPLFVSQLHCKN